jgi:hypothetical protein
MLPQLEFFWPLLVGVLVAAAVSWLVVLVGWFMRRRIAPGWAGAAAVAGGYLAGHVAALGWPAPPLEAYKRLFYLAGAAGVIGALAALRPRPLWRRSALHAILLVAAWGFLLHSYLGSSWGWGESAAWLGGLGAAGWVFWLSLEGLTEPPARWLGGLALLAVAVGTAAVFEQSYSALLFQLGLVLAATLSPALLGGRLLPDRGAATVLAVVLPGLWLISYFYGNAPWVALVLLAVAPSAVWLGRRQLDGHLRPWQTACLRGVVTLASVLLAVLIAHQARTPESDDYDYYSHPAAASPPAGSNSSPGLRSFTTPEEKNPAPFGEDGPP